MSHQESGPSTLSACEGYEEIKACGNDRTSALAIVDVDQLLSIVNGDKSLLKDMLEIFEQELPLTMAHLRSAMQSGDGRSFCELAHRLKGSLLAFSAQRAKEAVSALEVAAQEGNLQLLPRLLAEAEQEIALVLPSLRRLLD